MEVAKLVKRKAAPVTKAGIKRFCSDQQQQHQQQQQQQQQLQLQAGPLNETLSSLKKEKAAAKEKLASAKATSAAAKATSASAAAAAAAAAASVAAEQAALQNLRVAIANLEQQAAAAPLWPANALPGIEYIEMEKLLRIVAKSTGVSPVALRCRVALADSYIGARRVIDTLTRTFGEDRRDTLEQLAREVEVACANDAVDQGMWKCIQFEMPVEYFFLLVAAAAVNIAPHCWTVQKARECERKVAMDIKPPPPHSRAHESLFAVFF